MGLLNKGYLYSALLNEEPNSSVCESIDEVSEQEIENLKKEIKSKLTDIDYETYIKQFWVGLLEGALWGGQFP